MILVPFLAAADAAAASRPDGTPALHDPDGVSGAYLVAAQELGL